MDEMLVWRPIMAKLVTLADVHSGLVDIVDILKLNALLDMQAAQMPTGKPK